MLLDKLLYGFFKQSSQLREIIIQSWNKRTVLNIREHEEMKVAIVENYCYLEDAYHLSRVLDH